MYVCLFCITYLSASISVYLSVCVSVSLSVWLYECLSVCLSVCLAVCLSLCLCLRIVFDKTVGDIGWWHTGISAHTLAHPPPCYILILHISTLHIHTNLPTPYNKAVKDPKWPRFTKLHLGLILRLINVLWLEEGYTIYHILNNLYWPILSCIG